MTDKEEKIQDYIFDNEEWKNDKIVCPYCKSEIYNDDPAWLYQEREEEIECYECGKKFFLTSSYEWYYTTTPIKSEVEKILEEEDND